MGFDRIDICPKYAFPAHGVDQPNFHTRQVDVCREQVNALAVVQNTVAVRHGRVVDHILHHIRQRHGQLVRLRVAEGKRQEALRIGIDQQDPFVFLCKPDSEVSGGCGFTHAAFLVRHRNYFAIRYMGFLLCINLAACGEADGYVKLGII